MVLGMVLDVVLDNSTQLADNQHLVLDKQIISFFSIVEPHPCLREAQPIKERREPL